MRSRGFEVFTSFVAGVFLVLLGLFKMGFGIYTQTSFKNGLVGITAGIYTIAIGIARFIYIKKIDTDEKDQIITYRNIALLLIPIAIVFLISNILSLDDELKDYGIWIDLLITTGVVVLFCFSFKRAFRSETFNIMSRAIMITSFISALINIVFIEHLFEYQLNDLFGVELFREFKLYFSMGISGIIVLISLVMVIISVIKVHIYKKERGII